MNFFKRTIKHFLTICRHKRWVFHYACKAGIPWRGFWHDFSKFSPVEFWEGVKYYQGSRSPIDACKEAKGWSKAWFHHRGRNSHHYEYWVDNFDNGGVALKMPFKDAVELLCDYLAAGRAYMGKNFSYAAEYEWWLKKSAKPIRMHPHTKTFITLVLSELHFLERVNVPPLKFFNKKKLKERYEKITDGGEFNDCGIL
jgi:hypothetical protein